MSTKFIHLRHQTKDTIRDGAVILNEINPCGGMTIAYQVNDGGSVIGFAPAKCHSKDNYNKQQGRAKATGRLKSEKYFVPINIDEKEFHKLMQEYWKKERKLPGLKTPELL